MKSFPADFMDFLNPRRRARLQSRSPVLGIDRRLFWWPHLVDPAFVEPAIQLLDRHFSKSLSPVHIPIPESTITGMQTNYSESLPKTLRNRSVTLNSPRSKAFAEAQKIGLVKMLTSASLHRLAETLSGFRLNSGPGLQLIRYQQGDYVGPHNDHHPENADLRDGYIDLQITLTNNAVKRQLLVFQADGFLNQVVNVGIHSGISLSYLPFWHQVTPLEPKTGLETEAQRWLLLVSWSIDREQR